MLKNTLFLMVDSIFWNFRKNPEFSGNFRKISGFSKNPHNFFLAKEKELKFLWKITNFWAYLMVRKTHLFQF